MKIRHLFATAVMTVAASALAAGAASAATTMQSGQVGAAAGVNFLTFENNQFVDHADEHTKLDSWTGGAVRDLSATANAAKTLGLDNGTAQDTVTAHWDSADSGNVQLSDRGWTLHTPDAGIPEAVGGVADAGAPDWTYSFIAGADGQFRANFDITATGQTDGLGRWNLELIDNGQLSFFNLFSIFGNAPFDESVDFNHLLRAGHNYTVILLDDEVHIGRELPGPDVTASERGTFSWTISSSGTPEPATWALSIVGFGLAGSALRRRRDVEKLA